MSKDDLTLEEALELRDLLEKQLRNMEISLKSTSYTYTHA